MCGIAGIFFFDGRPVAKSLLEPMADVLRHRGPDEQRVLSRGSAGLAHSRLKIIDLTSNAAQPMCDEAKQYALVFNGEIYNFRELKRDLQRDFHFFSSSDTEVVLRLFQRDGERAWEQLNGMFAIAVHDAVTGQLFLARDHAGVKPLYYRKDAEKFLFASELKGLLATLPERLEIDIRAIALYLQFGYFPGEWTPYKDVKKLLPGHCAVVSKNGVQLRKYWGPHGSAVAADGPTDLDTLLQQAVERQMISDVPLGAFLSGGIDSSLIVALMKRTAREPVRTFTVGFRKMGYYDERRQAARIAQHLGAEHHEFVVDSGIEEIIPRLAPVFDEPFADSSAIPTLCLAELARRHVTVALSGTGGDEIFGGYRKYMAAHWASGYTSLPAAVRSGLSAVSSLLPSSRRSLWAERSLLLKRFLAVQPGVDPIAEFNSLFKPAEIEQMLGMAPDTLKMPAAGPTLAEQLMSFDFAYYLPEDLLVKEDRCTMAYGLEARVPFLDRAVVEFMARVPLKHKVNATSTKRLFRQVARNYLPDWVLRRPKHGFGSPVAEWLLTSLKDLASDLLFGPAAMIRDASVRTLWNQHQKRSADHSRQIWALLMLELWNKQGKTKDC